MSRHIPRRDRWISRGPSLWQSVDGWTVFYERGAWWAEIAYSLPGPPDAETDSPAGGLVRERLGPFKRPRNAMVELERHVIALENRHGAALSYEPLV